VIYLDHAATTPLVPEAREAMLRAQSDAPGNPASAHSAGRRARQVLEDARERVAALLHAEPNEVIFTSGATEANNLALFGLAGDPPGHILASPIEHPCVVEPLNQLAARGIDNPDVTDTELQVIVNPFLHCRNAIVLGQDLDDGGAEHHLFLDRNGDWPLGFLRLGCLEAPHHFHESPCRIDRDCHRHRTDHDVAPTIDCLAASGPTSK
jgi:cysteine desulfurase